MNPEEIERLENTPFFKEMCELGEIFSYLGQIPYIMDEEIDIKEVKKKNNKDE